MVEKPNVEALRLANVERSGGEILGEITRCYPPLALINPFDVFRDKNSSEGWINYQY